MFRGYLGDGERGRAFNITVNAILPGATVTEVARETVSPEQMKAMIQSRCIKRPQEVSDLTGVVGFLCSKKRTLSLDNLSLWTVA